MKRLYNYFDNLNKNNKISHSFLIGNVFYNEIKEELEEVINKILIDSNMKIEENPDIYILENNDNKIAKNDINDLINNVNKTSQFHKGKVYIIENVEKLNEFACNALLKTLEEPPENVYAILLTSNINDVKDTIYSRCQKIFISSVVEDKEIDEETNNIAIEIINELEKNNIKTISKMFRIYSIIDNRDMFINILVSMMNEYKKKLDELLIKSENIKEINTTIEKIIIINNCINRLNYPLNKNMLIDRFIIEIGRCINENS